MGSPNAPLEGDASDLFRTVFETPACEGATLHIAALGMGFARLNGQEVSEDRLLLSGWTDNEQRVLYNSYDVSSLLAPSGGPNVLAVAIGSGYRDLLQFPRLDAAAASNDMTHFRVVRAMLLATDGTNLLGGSSSWFTAPGPWLRTSIYNGEIYDARLEVGGWDADPALPMSSGHWTMAVALTAEEDAPQGAMVSSASFSPIQVTDVTDALSVTKVQDDSTGGLPIYVVDFGLNRAGVVRYSIPSSASFVNITLIHGEILAHDMLPTNETDQWGPPTIDPQRVYTGNLRSAMAADSYAAAAGARGRTHTARMSYHGFRFVEVHNWPDDAAAPTIQDFSQLHQRSNLNQRTVVSLPGQPVVETVFNLSLGAQRSNLMSVVTDCPQRDERLPWTGDLAL